MGKSVPVSAHIFFFKQSFIDEYRSGLNLDNSVLLIFFVIHRDKAVFKYSLTEDVSRFSQFYIFYRQFVFNLDDFLYWYGSGSTVKIHAVSVIFQKSVCNAVKSALSVEHFVHGFPSLLFLSLSIKSCHSSSVASRSFAVLRAETITRLSFRKAFRSFGIGFFAVCSRAARS